MAMVLRANKESSELGGHIARFQSAATLYDVGFNHFWHAATEQHGGDLVYIQGHCSPGIYARAFLEGRLTEEQLLNFRQEVDGNGLSSYPHPWLMPDFWQFPTVSMGLGPIMAIYQARFLKYLHDRGLADTAATARSGRSSATARWTSRNRSARSRWPAREQLDNLIFVINCNLQRLDGPVRGNGKIIQELEAIFRGAGWNVIKVIWGSGWDALLAQDTTGLLLKRMEECVDGEYQDFKSKDGAYVREHFFGKYPETRGAGRRHDRRRDLGADARRPRSGQGLRRLPSGGRAHGPADGHPGQDRQGLRHGRGRRGPEHHPPAEEDGTRTRCASSATASASRSPTKSSPTVPFLRFAEDSPEMKYLRERRAALGGYLPARRRKSPSRSRCRRSSRSRRCSRARGEREISTTMAFVRMLNALLRDKTIGKRVVPIVPDESRTFGMEGMFRQIGIYSQVGQLYEPEDADQLMFYREDQTGQILQEGINEAGAMSSWIAAATSYSTSATCR